MRLIGINLKEDQLASAKKEIEKKKLNPIFLAVFFILLGVVSTFGFLAYKRFFPRETKKVKVVKLAEVREKKPEGKEVLNATENETALPSVNKTVALRVKPEEKAANKTEAKKEAVKPPSQSLPVYFYVETDPAARSLIKPFCQSMFVRKKTYKERLVRVVACRLCRRDEAEEEAQKLRCEIPSLDPWVKSDLGCFLVVAGSYKTREGVINAVTLLKEHGYSPFTQDVYRLREKKVLLCKIEKGKLKKLREILLRKGFSFKLTGSGL